MATVSSSSSSSSSTSKSSTHTLPRPRRLCRCCPCRLQLSLRLSLLVICVIQLACSVLLWRLGYSLGSTTQEAISGQLRSQVSSTIIDQVQSAFISPCNVAKSLYFMYNFMYSGQLGVANNLTYVPTFLQPISFLSETPDVTSLGCGTRNGLFVASNRVINNDDFTVFRNTYFLIDSPGETYGGQYEPPQYFNLSEALRSSSVLPGYSPLQNEVAWVIASPDYNNSYTVDELLPWFTSNASFVLKSRPWWKAAIEGNGQIHFSPVYPSTLNTRLNIAAAKALIGPDGEPDFVCYASIWSTTLDNLLGSITTLGPHGATFIVDSNSHLLSTSIPSLTPSNNEELSRTNDTLAITIAEELIDQNMLGSNSSVDSIQDSAFEIDGATYRLTANRLNLTFLGLNLIAIVVTADADFVVDVSTNDQGNTAAIAVVFVMACIMIIFTYMLSLPLRRLVGFMNLLTQPLDTEINEESSGGGDPNKGNAAPLSPTPAKKSGRYRTISSMYLERLQYIEDKWNSQYERPFESFIGHFSETFMSEFSLVQSAFYTILLRLQSSYSSLENSHRAKQHFVRYICHEVRVPLNAVMLGLTELGEKNQQSMRIASIANPQAQIVAVSQSAGMIEYPCKYNEKKEEEEENKIGVTSPSTFHPPMLTLRVPSPSMPQAGLIVASDQSEFSASPSVRYHQLLMDHKELTTGSGPSESSPFLRVSTLSWQKDKDKEKQRKDTERASETNRPIDVEPFAEGDEKVSVKDKEPPTAIVLSQSHRHNHSLTSTLAIRCSPSSSPDPTPGLPVRTLPVDLTNILSLSVDSMELIDLLHQQTQVVARILNDVLSLTKIEDGALDLQFSPFSFPSMILSTMQSFEAVLHEKKCFFVVNLDDVGEEVKAKKKKERLMKTVEQEGERREDHNTQSEIEEEKMAPKAEEIILNGRGAPRTLSPPSAHSRLSPSKFDVIGDKYRLRQVLANFLSNAIKFSPEGGEITVSLRILEEASVTPSSTPHSSPTSSPAGGTKDSPSLSRLRRLKEKLRKKKVKELQKQEKEKEKQRQEQQFHVIDVPPSVPSPPSTAVPSSVLSPSLWSVASPLMGCSPLSTVRFFRVSVLDQGVGISPENQKKLFQPYMQILPGEQQAGKGTGLGLNISKSLIELHGGAIGFQAGKDGKGSEFFFELALPIIPRGALADIGEGSTHYGDDNLREGETADNSGFSGSKDKGKESSPPESSDSLGNLKKSNKTTDDQVHIELTRMSGDGVLDTPNRNAPNPPESVGKGLSQLSAFRMMDDEYRFTPNLSFGRRLLPTSTSNDTPRTDNASSSSSSVPHQSRSTTAKMNITSDSDDVHAIAASSLQEIAIRRDSSRLPQMISNGSSEPANPSPPLSTRTFASQIPVDHAANSVTSNTPSSIPSSSSSGRISKLLAVNSNLSRLAQLGIKDRSVDSETFSEDDEEVRGGERTSFSTSSIKTRRLQMPTQTHSVEPTQSKTPILLPDLLSSNGRVEEGEGESEVSTNGITFHEEGPIAPPPAVASVENVNQRQSATVSMANPLMLRKSLGSSPSSSSSSLSLPSTPLNFVILIAEDSVTNRKLLMMLLKRLNFQCYGVENGEMVITIFKEWMKFAMPNASPPLPSPTSSNNSDGPLPLSEFPPGLPSLNTSIPPFDLILMDGNMPRINGIDATRQLRTMGITVPIVAVTGNAMDEDVGEFIQAGANDLITKPINEKILRAKLEKQLQAKLKSMGNVNAAK